MSKLFYLITLFSVYTLCAKTQNDTLRIKLNISEITSIQMKKVNPKNATLSRELYLKPKDINAFVSKYNSFDTDTSMSIKPKYFLFVTFKNKNVLYLAISGNQITDSKCKLSASDAGLFFDKLWDELTE